MKRFLKKTVLFLFVPVTIISLIEAILPPTFFSYRTGEGLQYKSGIIPHFGHFYPNTASEMMAQGDLCFHTKYRTYKKEAWHIDALGFRNDSVIQEADIVIIGDSFMGGYNSTQDEIFSKRLAAALGGDIKIYNMAPATVSLFDKLLKTGSLKKPKLIIYESVERNWPPIFEPYAKRRVADLRDDIGKFFERIHFSTPLDKALRFYSVEWMRSRIRNVHGFGSPSVDTTLFFFEGKTMNHDESEFNATINGIQSYKKYCDELGIDFLYLPMPDKESVYYEQVPFEKQPDYLFRIDSAMKAEHIPALNILETFNEHRKHSNSLLYYHDDTHWNLTGKELIAKELANRIKTGEFGKGLSSTK